MPLKVALILRLNYTKYEDTYFHMDLSNVKIVGKVKDITVNLDTFPSKKLLMSILVVDMPISYGMLLGR